MQQQPKRNMLYGINFRPEDDAPIIRETKSIKISIGISKGRASYIYTFGGRWIIRYGAFDDKGKLQMLTAKGSDGKAGFPTRKEAETWYYANKHTFAQSNRPQKLQFFTFTRRRITDVNGKPEESFEPDWDMIELHGDTPREIDIVFMGTSPLFSEYQSWSKTKLNCHGDGLNALRLVTLGSEEWPGWKEANEAGEKYFSLNQCWVSGKCPYANARTCKPTSVLTFQLAKNICLGATAYFSTTGIESAIRLFSSIKVIEEVAGRAGSSIANTVMRLVMAPYQTNHDGIAATQHAVSVELRSQDLEKLRLMLEDSAWKPRAHRELVTVSEEDQPSMPMITAGAMHDEFFDAEFEDADEPEAPVAAKVKTDEKGEKLAANLKAAREKAVAAPVAVAVPVAAVVDPAVPAAAVAAAAVVPETVAPPAENPWPARVTKEYFTRLGPSIFQKVLLETVGEMNSQMVTEANHTKVWNAMTTAAKKLEAEVAAAEKDDQRETADHVATGTTADLF